VPSTLRIASFNLLHGIDLSSGAVDLDRAAEAAAALDADVLAVQEADRDQPRSGERHQVAELAERLGGDWRFAPALLGDPGSSWRALGNDDPGGPAYGVGIISRVPVQAAHRLVLPGGGDGHRSPNASLANPGYDREPRVGLRLDLEVDGRALAMTTTHLSYLPWRGLAQLRAVARKAADGAQAAILIGDLNLPRWLSRPATLGWTNPRGLPTYPSWRPRVQPDQVMVRGAVAIERVRTVSRTTSDHLPVVADLRLA